MRKVTTRATFNVDLGHRDRHAFSRPIKESMESADLGGVGRAYHGLDAPGSELNAE